MECLFASSFHGFIVIGQERVAGNRERQRENGGDMQQKVDSNPGPLCQGHILCTKAVCSSSSIILC